MKLYTSKGVYISSSVIDGVGSFADKLSSGWPRFYYKGLRGIAVVKKASTGTVIVTIPDIIPIDKQNEIYNRIISHEKFDAFLESIPNELIGVDILIDSESLERITVDSFMELLPADLTNQIFIMTSEGENSEEIDHWPPMKITSLDSTSLAILLAAFSAPKRCHKPHRGTEWTTAGRMLLISLCSTYYEHELNFDSFSPEQIANRQKFYVPKKDRPRLVLPADALSSLDALSLKIQTEITRRDAIEKMEKQKKANKESKEDSNSEDRQLALLPSVGKKAIFLSDLLQVGIDKYLNQMEEHVSETVEIDMQLEASLHIKGICLFGGAIIIDTGGNEFNGERIKEMFGTENVFHAEMN